MSFYLFDSPNTSPNPRQEQQLFESLFSRLFGRSPLSEGSGNELYRRHQQSSIQEYPLLVQNQYLILPARTCVKCHDLFWKLQQPIGFRPASLGDSEFQVVLPDANILHAPLPLNDGFRILVEGLIK
jgi:hypothetical protein